MGVGVFLAVFSLLPASLPDLLFTPQFLKTKGWAVLQGPVGKPTGDLDGDGTGPEESRGH